MAQSALGETRADYDAKIEIAKAKVSAAQQRLTEAKNSLEAAEELQSETNLALLDAQELFDSKSLTAIQKEQAVEAARIQVEQAQYNYDNTFISDPDWTAPTYQKEHTRTVTLTRQVEVRTLVPQVAQVQVKTLVPHTTVIATGGVKAEVFNRQGYNNAPPLPFQNEVPISTTTVQTINFNWGSGNILNSGRSEDVIVRFTGNLLVPEDNWYQFYSPADDGTQLNIAGMGVINDWRDKGGGGTISEPVWIRAGIFYPFTLHYYENGGGASVGFYTYTPQQGFSLVPETWIGSGAEQVTTYKEVTTLETVTTYEEVITYEEEIYYTYETYYTTELLLTEGTVDVKINEGGEATFVAPGGATFVSSNLRYEAIDNPNCGTNIRPKLQGNTIQLVADNSIWGDPCGGWYKHIVGTISYLGEPTAPLIKNPELLLLLKEPQSIYNDAVTEYGEAQASLENIFTELKTLQDKKIENQVKIDVAQNSVTIEEEELIVSQQELEAIPPFRDPAPTPEKTEEPAEEPTKNEPEPLPDPDETTAPEASQPELPVDVSTVDPQSLSAEQVSALVSVANEILENSEQGSEEYEEALDALFIAAEANDIELDPSLAAVPGLSAAVGAINFIGNVGADMSPKVREESEKIVLTAVVAVGAAVNAATGAALTASSTSAPASSSASAGGSGGTSSTGRKD